MSDHDASDPTIGRPAVEPETTRERVSRLGLAALMIGAGVTHFVSPGFYDDLVPDWMPGDPRTVTQVSGFAELTVGTLLLGRRTARVGGWSTAALLVAVYPANVQMALDAGAPADAEGWAAWLRLPLQVPLVVWAVRVARRS